MKRVKQISIDILVDDTVNGVYLADAVTNILEGKQLTVVGCCFNEDLTEDYMEYLPSLFNE